MMYVQYNVQLLCLLSIKLVTADSCKSFCLFFHLELIRARYKNSVLLRWEAPDFYVIFNVSICTILKFLF